MTATKNGINRRAFQKGLGEVKAKDLPAVRAEIMALLGVTSQVSFRNYANGKVQTLDIEKYEGIDQVFKRYGVASPWGLV